VRDYLREHRIPPTTRELALALGVTQTCAMQYVVILERKGYLNRQEGKARSITLVDEIKVA
jgi:SOS-response transcriptional repressor LexA